MRSTLMIAAASFCVCIPAAAQAQVDLKGDRYTCYVVEAMKGGSVIPAKKLRDQFGSGAGQVMKPRYVCNPTEVNGRKVVDLKTHIVCYEVQSPVKPRRVSITTEFETVPYVELGPAHLLCLPARKTELK